MDILIKNMKMPKDNKRIFLCIEKDGEVGVFEEKKLIRFTEAQELPPHGRLVDAEILEEKVEATEYRGNQPDDGGWEMGRDTALCLIYEAPTIVEASE